VIAVDTSALMAIALDEPRAEACMAALQTEDEVVISAGTLAEALIVAGRRNVSARLSEFIRGFGLSVVVVSQAAAERVAQAYSQWGKGVHPAGLNMGDCFAYEVAKRFSCPLLYVGEDFAKTDVESVL
jgi:ribonuclease VapC